MSAMQKMRQRTMPECHDVKLTFLYVEWGRPNEPDRVAGPAATP
jgi:hypothetical protein